MAGARILTDSDRLLSHLPMPVLVIGADGKVSYVNDATESFFGHARRRLEGAKAEDLLQFKNQRLNDALNSGGDDLTAQDMMLKLGSDIANVDITITRMTGKPEEERLVILSPRKPGRSHISDRPNDGMQQAVGASAILSHEIKNPLAGIKGGAQLLAKTGDETQQPLIDLIIAEVDRIARLLDQMQDLGGTQARESKAENIHLLIERAIRSIRAANSDIPSVSINYDPSLPDVMIDGDGMVQILINLFQNAMDALAGQEDAEIGVSTRYVMSGALREAPEEARDGTTLKLPVEIIISDNGPGVPPHIAGELFSPFVTTKRDGQGLGLAIVRKLMQQMRSRILYERIEQPARTMFKLYLPVASRKNISKTGKKP